MDIKPPVIDVLLDPTGVDFATASDDEVIYWMRFDVPEAIDEFNRRVAQRQE